jgi:hypothetical protein
LVQFLIFERFFKHDIFWVDVFNILIQCHIFLGHKIFLMIFFNLQIKYYKIIPKISNHLSGQVWFLLPINSPFLKMQLTSITQQNTFVETRWVSQDVMKMLSMTHGTILWNELFTYHKFYNISLFPCFCLPQNINLQQNKISRSLWAMDYSSISS